MIKLKHQRNNGNPLPFLTTKSNYHINEENKIKKSVEMKRLLIYSKRNALFAIATEGSLAFHMLKCLLEITGFNRKHLNLDLLRI